MPHTIKHRWTSAVIFHSDTAACVAEAVTEAIKAKVALSGADLSGAYLRDADLSDADLSGAYLSGADLSGAYLSGAYLSGAYLSGADLSGAYLSDADLSDAYLSDAYLSDAYLSDADLSDAYLSGADLRDAYLRGADLRGAYLSDADLSGAYLSGANGYDGNATPPKPRPEVPVIPNIHQTVLAAVTAEGCSLQMDSWHMCETTHCRAGWVVHLAGEKGKALESVLGTRFAAAEIYRASDPGCRVPHFFCDNSKAMEDIKACAAAEAAKAAP